jgi:hypothetical protein
MNQERYWRNLIADEIKAEHDKVKKYYQKKGMNTGGMSPEEHTRLNIFLLCESISRTMKNSQDAPREEIISTPEPVEDINDFIEEQMSLDDITIKDVVPDLVPEVVPDPVPDPMPDPIQSLVKDTPYQNEFGEIL